jgi:hypothetical protein
LFLTAVPGCGQRPKVDVTAGVENDQIVFNIAYSDVNGILGFGVEDTSGTPLWKVDLNYFKGHKITYGKTPKGDKQQLPENGAAPPSIRGNKVRVIVQVQYDDWVPSARHFSKVLDIP